MKVGDLVRVRHHSHAGVGVITKVYERDLSFYKSHTYLVQFVSAKRRQWWQDYEMEVLCK